MLAKLYDTFFPTNFPALTNNPAHWTGDALSAKLKAMDPALPSHRNRAEEMRKLIDSCIASSREGQLLGSAAAVRRAYTGTLTIPTAELCLDYREVSMFLSNNA
jgi:hypothetical protein